ncbi:GntR family transcriptional regulator [Pseudomonas sp. 1-7]|nr:GntR family transcriptional regulator [Pseudomonas sp. 1-7]
MPLDKRNSLIMPLSLGAPAPGVSLQTWLYQSLRERVIAGRLPTGARLPSTRALAEHYGIARGTVQAAYQQLLSEGYLQAMTGSGTRVSEVLPDPLLHSQLPPEIEPSVVPLHELPSTPWVGLTGDIYMTFGRKDVTPSGRPFSPQRGDISAFPIDIWQKMHARQLRSTRLSMLQDPDPSGASALREAIADYLSAARGVKVSAERILVLSSMQQGIDLCLRLLVQPGQQVWLEDPSCPGSRARELMDISGCNIVNVPVDKHGLLVDEGVRHAPQARLAYVTPSRQLPTGGEMSVARRLALLRWATETGAYIIEDDYDSEYRFIAKPIPALRSLPTADSSVILAGTFSKVMFPAIRLAYLVLPSQLVEPFVRASALTAGCANSLSQAVMASFITDGHFERHIRRMRKLYASRADALAEAAHRHWRGLIEVPPIRTGIDVICQLQMDDEAAAYEALTEQGIDLLPMSAYCHTPLPPAIVIGFAPYDEKAIFDAAQVVRKTLEKLLQG